MAALDGRADQFTWYDNPAQPRTITFVSWPAGFLAGVDMELRVTGQSAYTCTVDDTAHTVTVDVVCPATVGSYAANLWDVTDPDAPQLRIRGLLVVSTDPRTSGDLTVEVNVVDAVGTVEVGIVGGGGGGSGDGFPLTADVSAAGFDIQNLGALTFDGTPDATFNVEADTDEWRILIRDKDDNVLGRLVGDDTNRVSLVADLSEGDISLGRNISFDINLESTNSIYLNSGSIEMFNGSGVDGTGTPSTLVQLADFIVDLGVIASHTITNPSGGASGLKRARKTSGNTTINSASFANFDTGLDLVVPAATGDVLEYQISGSYGGSSSYLVWDVATIVSGSPVHYFGEAGGAGDFGVSAWYNQRTGDGPINGAGIYTVQSGDISSGNVTLRLRYRQSSATNMTVYSNSTLPFDVWCKNLGPLTP